MTPEEYEGWKRQTENSRHHWQHDTITHHNHGEHLFYIGGESGSFIRVSTDGIASIGTYQYALPHIGEAEFTVKHTKKLADTADEALGVVLQHLGLTFLLDFIGVH